MATKEPVVCFSCYDYWHSNPGSPYHIMHAIRQRGHPVLWINSIGMNLPKMRRRGFRRRASLRLRSWSRWLRAAEPGFHVLAPVALPLFGNKTIEKWNDRWLSIQLRLAYRRLGFRQPLVVTCMPAFAGVIASLPRTGLIYYYTDKYDAYRDITARDAILARDRQLFQAADVVFCASRKVYTTLVDQRAGVHYLPHAVDFDHFQRAVEHPGPVPPDLATIPHPRVGYFGSLTDSNDQELIRYAAQEDPGLQFVLIGRVLADYAALARLPNVHLLGYKPYAQIPAYGRHFDVAFMGWKMTDWIRHSSPVKTKEYLSLGLPVVANPIEELQVEFSDLVYFASTPAEFLAAIRCALAEDSAGLRRRRIERVRGESWDARVDEMLARLAEVRHDG